MEPSASDPASEFVARLPTVDVSFWTERLAFTVKSLANAREYLPRFSQNAQSIFSRSLTEAGLRQMVEPDSPSIITAFQRAGRAAIACCDMLAPGEGLVTLDIMDGPVSAARASRNTFLNIAEFIDGFYAALAVGDDATLDRLAEVDLQTLHADGIFPEAYTFHWARALQGFHLRAPWSYDAYKAAFIGSAPEQLRNGPVSEAYMFFKSTLEMELLVATAGDPETFNAVLLRALQYHCRWLEVEPNPGEVQSDDAAQFIALGPSAFAAAMSRRGWPITVRSDYLPRCLLAP